MNPVYLGVLADVLDINAADIVREVEGPRREARLRRAAALLAPEPAD